MAQPFGRVALGKTKEGTVYEGAGAVIHFENFDIVTWDDKYAEPMPGKGAWATTTTSNVFSLLQQKGMGDSVAFIKQSGPTTFEAVNCAMIPVEVVLRHYTDEKSSLKKRNPNVPVGPIAELQVEFYLKTSKKRFADMELTHDDMYIGKFDETGVWVYPPKDLYDGTGGTFIPIEKFEGTLGHNVAETFAQMAALTLKAGAIVRDGWAKQGWKLKDFKLEYGFAPWGKMLLADVWDNDSWRIEDPDGIERSKQNVRNGKPIPEAAKDYEMVAAASFGLLKAA